MEKIKKKIKRRIQVETLEEVMALVETGVSIDAACKKVGVSRSRFYDLIDEDPVLSDKLARARERSAAIYDRKAEEIGEEFYKLAMADLASGDKGKLTNPVVMALRESMQEYRRQAAIRNPRRYSEIQRREVTADVKASARVSVEPELNNLSEEQLERLQSILKQK